MGVINFTFIFTFKRVKSSTFGQHMATKALANIFVTTADDFIVRPKTLIVFSTGRHFGSIQVLSELPWYPLIHSGIFLAFVFVMTKLFYITFK